MFIFAYYLNWYEKEKYNLRKVKLLTFSQQNLHETKIKPMSSTKKSVLFLIRKCHKSRILIPQCPGMQQ